MTIAKEIQALNVSAKKVHGQDISILVARAIAFGNDDNLILVMGKNHKAAATDVARMVKGAKVSEETSTDGKVYSSVKFY